jgi:hypothetical protein
MWTKGETAISLPSQHFCVEYCLLGLETAMNGFFNRESFRAIFKLGAGFD